MALYHPPVTPPLADTTAPLRRACQTVGLDCSDLRPLRRHATDVYLLPGANAVAKVAHRTQDAAAAQRAVHITQWLQNEGFPAVEPLPVTQPVFADHHQTITFWRYYPQTGRTAPPASALGHLLRHLHSLPAPPVLLPTYSPLSDMHDLIAHNTLLDADDQHWLLDERDRLLEDFRNLDSPLGAGHIHGDAYPGNTLWSGDSVLLGDWDETAVGPRELDLANTFQGIRFGRSHEQLDAFTRAYGHDPRDWNGLRTLTALRDLHTLKSYLHRATADNSAGSELQHRIATLRARNNTATWNAT